MSYFKNLFKHRRVLDDTAKSPKVRMAAAAGCATFCLSRRRGDDSEANGAAARPPIYFFPPLLTAVE